MKVKTVWGQVRVIPENELAVMACRQIVAASRGRDRTPFHVLYLHGETGTGKTALVTVLASRCGPSTVVSAVDFSRNEGAVDFRIPELLVVEDVHRLPLPAVERLVTTLDDRAARRRTTVVTAAESPFDLRGLPRRLTSRLGGGLTVSLSPPSVESRVALLASYMKEKYRRFTGEDLPPLAERTEGGLRELFSAADQWVAERTRRLDRLGASIRVDEAKEAERGRDLAARVAEQWGAGHPVNQLLVAVAKAFRLKPDDIHGDLRLPSVLVARQVSAFLAIHVLGLSRRNVAAYLGRKPDAFQYVKDDLRMKTMRDPALRAIVAKLENDWRAKVRKVVARTSTEESDEAREGEDD